MAPRKPKINAELIAIVEDFKSQEEDGTSKYYMWSKCLKTLKDEGEVIGSREQLQGLKYFGEVTTKRVWRKFEADQGGMDDDDGDAPGPSRPAARKKKAAAASPRSKKKPGRPAKRYLDDIDQDEEGEDFSEHFPAAKRPANAATYTPDYIPAYTPAYPEAYAPPLVPVYMAQPAPNDPTRLDGFQFWYITDKDKHARAAVDAYVVIVPPNLMMKIEYPRAQSTHPWALTYIRDQQPGGPNTYYGFIPDTVGDILLECPGISDAITAPAAPPLTRNNSISSSSQQAGRPVVIAPVPLDRRTSSNGGLSNSSLLTQLAKEREARRKSSSIDPSRNSAARVGLDALAGVGIRSTPRIPMDRSSSPVRADDSFPGNGNSMASSSQPMNYSSSPVRAPIRRTATLPAIPSSPLVPAPSRTNTNPTVQPARRPAPRASNHIPAPRPYDHLDDELEDSQPRFEPRSSETNANSDGSDAERDNAVGDVYSSTHVNYEAPFEPYVFPAGTYDIALVLDNREGRGDNEAVAQGLARKGIEVQRRALAIGDVAWIATKKMQFVYGSTGPQEVVLDYVLERKRMDDLVESVKTGRFHEQKFRLKESGIGHVYYLVEHFHTAQKRETYGKMIDTAMSSTQVVDGFMVKETAGAKETMAFLATMHKTLVKVYKDRPLYIIPDARIRRHSYTLLQQHLRHREPDRAYLTSWDTFQRLNAKSGLFTLRENFARILLCINGLSPEKVSAILEHYDTPIAFWGALLEAEQLERDERIREEEEQAATGKGKGRKKSTVPLAKHMLTRLPNVKGRRKIGEALSEKIYDIFRAEEYDD